jgi:hypothetical protein
LYNSLKCFPLVESSATTFDPPFDDGLAGDPVVAVFFFGLVDSGLVDSGFAVFFLLLVLFGFCFIN